MENILQNKKIQKKKYSKKRLFFKIIPLQAISRVSQKQLIPLI